MLLSIFFSGYLIDIILCYIPRIVSNNTLLSSVFNPGFLKLIDTNSLLILPGYVRDKPTSASGRFPTNITNACPHKDTLFKSYSPRWLKLEEHYRIWSASPRYREIPDSITHETRRAEGERGALFTKMIRSTRAGSMDYKWGKLD